MKKEKIVLARGKVLHRIAKTNPLSIKEITEKAGYKYPTFFVHIKQDNLPYEILAKYGKAMKHDFSNEFPAMAEYFSDNKGEAGKQASYEDLLADRDKWKEKYFEATDKYNNLADRYNKLLEERLGLESND